jgi:hypothetical protein
VIVDPDGKGPIYFQLVPEGKGAKNRMHMDLTVSGAGGATLSTSESASWIPRLRGSGPFARQTNAA